jgi:hypothetical protein
MFDIFGIFCFFIFIMNIKNGSGEHPGLFKDGEVRFPGYVS